MRNIFILLISLFFITGCNLADQTPVDTKSEEGQNAQMANPASVKCIEGGGKLDIRTDENGGQYGVCIFADYECEEWAYFRGECQNSENNTDCTKEDKPVCALVEIQCITTPCDPVLETFDNHCLAEARNSVIDFVDGKCEKKLDDDCKINEDCMLPMDYAIRSNCPFAAKCLNQQCVVVCPDF